VIFTENSNYICYTK